MEKNNRIFKGILVMALILILAGSGSVYYFRLDAPVFFPHYYDLRVQRDDMYAENLVLKYVTNAYDTREVTAAQFVEMPEVTLYASEREEAIFSWESQEKGVPGEIHGRYSVRKVYVRNLFIPEEVQVDGKIIRNLKVQFDDGSEMTVDIGELHLYEPQKNGGESPYEHVSSSGSSDGTSLTVYRMLEELTLAEVKSPLADKLKGRLDWRIDEKFPEEAVGHVYGERSILNVSSEVLPGEDVMEAYAVFDVQPQLTFTDGEGKPFTQRFYNMRSQAENYSFSGLRAFIRERGEKR
ncbi:hypothetical protein J3A84_10640 [Proteiniclasticum sp. SCR006]|uniref:Uncharacterized protein n=1 Tax=Proteiniclasticum aestuarii TaxID=2817862 RepID=A0A939HAD0_9CLOT|nr:hypothetical protein [Proteiniclasticum aestuarii]MBO1265489.1 hypothetical protein [Proteiniclasticum aestuarii]